MSSSSTPLIVMIMLFALSFVMAQETESETAIDTDVNQDIQVPSDVEELPEFVEIEVETDGTVHSLPTEPKHAQKAKKDKDALWMGFIPIKGDDERWSKHTVQLFNYPNGTEAINVTGMMKFQPSMMSVQFKELLFTNSTEAVYEIKEPALGIWEIKNLYDAKNESFTTLQFKDGWAAKGRIKHKFTSALAYAGAIQNITRPVGELLWTGSVDLVFDVTDDWRGWGSRIHPHHQETTRTVEISKIPRENETDYALIRWTRHPAASSDGSTTVIFTELEDTKNYTTFTRDVLGGWQIKIEKLTDESDRATGTLFMKNIEADGLEKLYAALSQLGIAEVTLDRKVESRQGGILLWAGSVRNIRRRKNVENEKPFPVQVWKYLAVGDEEEDIGVLQVEQFYNKDEEDEGVMYISLNGVPFTKGKNGTCQVKLERFTVAQRVRGGKVSDAELKELNWNVVGLKRDSDGQRYGAVDTLCDGPDGSEMLYAALVEAGAF